MSAVIVPVPARQAATGLGNGFASVRRRHPQAVPETRPRIIGG